MSIKYKYIVIEGPDGVGKTTIINLLYNKLKELDYNIYLIKEPSNNKIGELIRNILNDIDLGNKYDILSLMSLFFSDRFLLQKDIENKLKEGYIIISDRNWISTLVYQGIIGNIDKNIIINLGNLLIKPDIIIILESNENIILKRLSERKKLSIYENLDFIKKEIDGYRKVKEILKDYNIVYIDNSKDINQTIEKILNIIIQ